MSSERPKPAPKKKEIAIPSSIGRYDVEKLLGQGGMGRVWLARDTVLERRVAIKVLRDDLSLPPSVRGELLTRMRHEARAAAAVSHPNIVTLHDMGEDPSVGLYLVFEYVPAPPGQHAPEEQKASELPESLRDRIRQGPLPLADVARLARELGSALSFAHEAGVIHRDVKPENILFSRTGAKIADFGIARIPESTITRENMVLGTPAYTAPEALSKGQFGPASDQFSLAATLYEATTGARAFDGDNALVTAGKVSTEAAASIPPTVGSPAVVKALNRAFERGLSKDASERFASASELGDCVARAIEWPPLSDAPLARAEGGGLISEIPPAPSTGRLPTLERTPLSSRNTLSRSSEWPAPPEAVSRPSLMAQRATNRFQNIVAAAALLVIVGLVLMGRKKRSDVLVEDAGAPTAVIDEVIAPPPVKPTAHAGNKPAPRPSAPPLTSSASTASAADAGEIEPPRDAQAEVPRDE